MSRFQIPSIWPALLTCGGIMLYLISLAPWMADNYIFSRAISPGFAGFYSGSPAQFAPLSLASAWQQALDMYSGWCGRFTGNLAVFLLFLLPAWLYAIVAACLYCLYLLALGICVFGRAWRAKLTNGWIFAIAALLWAGIPAYGEAFFWLSVGGQIALLGQALIFIPFRLSLDAPLHCAGPSGFLATPGLFLAGICVAMLDFATSAALPPTAIACVLYLWLFRREPFPWLLAACAAGLCLGGFLTITAPGNACRLALTTDTDVIHYLAASWPDRILDWLAHLPSAALSLAVPLIFLIYGCLRLQIRNFPIPALLFILPALLTLGAYLFTAWPPDRALATPAAQLIVAACIVFAAQPKGGRLFRLLRASLCLYCACTLVYEAWQFQLLHEEASQREALFAEGQTEAPPLTVRPDKYQPLGDRLGDISEDANFWINRAVAAWHGLPFVRLARASDAEYEYRATDGKIIRIKSHAGRIAIEEGPGQKLHIYYHGAPGLLASLPFGLDKLLYEKLAQIQPGDWRMGLVPLLMARVDLDSGETSEQLKLANSRKLWLVNPGKPWYSPDVLPLAKLPASRK